MSCKKWILLSHQLGANSKTHNLLLWSRLIWRCVHMIKFVVFFQNYRRSKSWKISKPFARSKINTEASRMRQEQNNPYKFCFRKNSPNNSYNKSPWIEDWLTILHASLALATSLRTIPFRSALRWQLCQMNLHHEKVGPPFNSWRAPDPML